MGENELYAVFDPDFIRDIETLGNSVIISKYYIEDIRTDITDVSELLSEDYRGYPYDNGNTLTGFWDSDKKEFKVHISLPERLYSWKVKNEGTNDDPSEFEIESKDYNNINDGDGLVRLIRFKCEDTNKTSFIVLGNIVTSRKLVVEPIECNQDKILLTIKFPSTTQANIRAKDIEKDTKLLEGFGVMRGLNIFTTVDKNELASRLSAKEYYNYTTTRTRLWRKETPYVEDDGRFIARRDSFRVYTEVRVYCSELLTNILPNTRGSLDKFGGIIKIYGEAKYDSFEIRGSEFIYTGTGIESIDGIPDSKLILTTHNNGLTEPKIIDKFYVSYGRFEGQSDPSVLVKCGIYFWNPFISSGVDYIESSNIKLTQSDDIIPDWEIIYRSTTYTEPNNIPAYLFPWKSGYQHSFIIRTVFPNLSNQDFEMIYEDPILESYFDYSIERIPNREYPITDYKIILTSIGDNLEDLKWFPIVNGESIVKISTLRLKNYEYTESFYYIQAPKVPEIELHDQNNQNIPEIILEYNQTNATYYPVAKDARTQGEIGERNAWRVIDHDSRVIPLESWGMLNPDNPDTLETAINISIPENPDSIRDIDLGKLVIGRIKESEWNSIIVNDWRSIVYLSTVNIPINKRGIVGRITSDESIVIREINLYKIKVVCNGPFACWMNPSDDYCFFNPSTNTITETNYYYSRNFDSNDGVYIYLALHKTVANNEDPIEVGKILFTVSEEEPIWGNERPDIFSDQTNLATCTIYQQAPERFEVSYINPNDAYVFLEPNISKAIKFKSTENPVIDRLQFLDTPIIERLPDYSYQLLNQDSVSTTDLPTPAFSIGENYKYHIQHILSSNSLRGYYPISPCCIYRAHSYNNSDSVCPFFIFRKALEPSLYRSDSGNSNVIFMVNDPNSVNPSDKKKTIAIKSRYQIPDTEFITEFEVFNGFEIENITETTLTANDYKYQYTVTLNLLVQNTGSQRQLGTLTITSRIYNLITLTNYELPYINLTQDEIDEIATPASIKFLIIQAAGNGGNTGEIQVRGDSDPSMLPSEVNRAYSIISNVPIELPEITNILGCTIGSISTSGFSVNVPSRVEGYSPVIPSSTNSYTSFTQIKNINFDLLINSIDNLVFYSETFRFNQYGFNNGLIYGSLGNPPKLYLGQTSITEFVDSSTTSFDILLGVFNIENQILEGDKGTTRGINIGVDNLNNSYDIHSSICTYYNSSWVKTATLIFPENNTEQVINRVFTITYNNNNFLHKIVVTLKQSSGRGNIICNDNAYFLSHGECIETDNYSEDMGFFTFDTDLDIRSLSLDIPESLYESYSFIYIGPSSLGGNYNTYKAQIKLQPNLSNSIIEKQIFSFLKDGESIKNVYINQGYYCLKLYYPDSLYNSIYSGGVIGDTREPIIVPSESSDESLETRKVFRIELSRSEPKPSNGQYTKEIIDITDEENIIFPTVNSYTWIYDSSELNQSININILGKDPLAPSNKTSTYLKSYTTEIFNEDLYFNYPFLENIYTVYSEYYKTEVPLKINFTILVDYPYSDPLYDFKKNTEHSYTIYLRKEEGS